MADFDYTFAYEDRDELRTSRWKFTGVKTLAAGNTDNGRLWAKYSLSDTTLTVDLYKDVDAGSSDKVATGTVTTVAASLPAKCTFTAENTSAIAGEMYLEAYTSTPSAVDEVIVALCTDADLSAEYGNLADLPQYSTTTGMADEIAIATRKTLLLASNLFAGELGGVGAPEHRNRKAASRLLPDWRRIANVDQLRDVCVHWALHLAFHANHERSDNTMYSELAAYHDDKRMQAADAWQLAINGDPDYDEDAESTGNVSVVMPVRL